MRQSTGILILISFLISSCSPLPQAQIEVSSAPTAVPGIQLPETDQIVFTILNTQPWPGREGEPRPDWLGWGAETFMVAPDGSFWIADTAVSPNRLLHYSPKGELLLERSLENQVVNAYDLAVTRDSLWVLDISAEQPKIVQLNMDGGFLSSINIPREIMTYDRQFVSNGIFSIFPGEKDGLLLDSVNGYYEALRVNGAIVFQPMAVLTYYGHTYRLGTYDQVTGRMSLYMDGAPFEISPDFFVLGDPFLGFNPDNSFAIVGYVQTADGREDQQVRYYSSSGELLGTARQRPQTFYKDGNHHLAFGPDGSVYQLLCNPDHSVQILRLGFSTELPPISESPVLTPTPLTALHPSGKGESDEEQARNTLLAFFDKLSKGNYAEATALFGGEVSEYAREPLPGETLDAYWKYLCGFLWCLPVADITDTEQAAGNEFIFHLVFMHPNGARFEIGACCGGDPAATPPVWQFAYPVRKIDGAWKVMRGPLFTP